MHSEHSPSLPFTAPPVPAQAAPPSVSARSFQLVIESAPTASPPAAAEMPFLAVPTRVSFLVQRKGVPALSTRRPARPTVAFEPVVVGSRPRLLALQAGPGRVRLNGLKMPPVALLQVRDQLQVDVTGTLHVTELRSGGAVPPSPAQVGTPCGVCRLPVTAQSRVYVCQCGVLLHLEGAPIPAEDRLECALVGDTCPSCTTEIVSEGGHVWLPELWS